MDFKTPPAVSWEQSELNLELIIVTQFDVDH